MHGLSLCALQNWLNGSTSCFIRYGHCQITLTTCCHITAWKMNVSNFCVNIATGCSNIIPPEDAYLKRVDDKTAIIGCYETRQTWQLSCQGNQWTGTVGVCDSQTEHHHYDNTFSGRLSLLLFSVLAQCCY